MGGGRDAIVIQDFCFEVLLDIFNVSEIDSPLLFWEQIPQELLLEKEEWMAYLMRKLISFSIFVEI